MYSVYSPLSVRQPEGRSIYKLAESIGAKVAHGDGNDVIESRKLLEEIIYEMKNNEPSTWFVEFDTYRWREHCGYQFDNHIFVLHRYAGTIEFHVFSGIQYPE